MAYTGFEDQVLGVQPITGTDTTKNHDLGTVVRVSDPTYGMGEFIYLKGAASTAVGDVVSYNAYTGATTRWAGTANTGIPLAVAMSANTSTSAYGWYQIAGNAVVAITGTVTAGDSAYFSATAALKTAAAAGKQVLNCVAATANAVPSSGFAVYTIQRPFAQGAIT